MMRKLFVLALVLAFAAGVSARQHVISAQEPEAVPNADASTTEIDSDDSEQPKVDAKKPEATTSSCIPDDCPEPEEEAVTTPEFRDSAPNALMCPECVDDSVKEKEDEYMTPEIREPPAPAPPCNPNCSEEEKNAQETVKNGVVIVEPKDIPENMNVLKDDPNAKHDHEDNPIALEMAREGDSNSVDRAEIEKASSGTATTKVTISNKATGPQSGVNNAGDEAEKAAEEESRTALIEKSNARKRLHKLLRK